jgi:YVTN family beta-propeller protein
LHDDAPFLLNPAKKWPNCGLESNRMTGARSAGAIASSTLEFRVLGRVEALRDGVPLALGPRKQRAVLALLLLNANRVVSSERLIEDLWGDSPPQTARATLQVYIARLRKALGGDGTSLRTSLPGYVLDVEPGALDLDRFTALRVEAHASTDDEEKARLLRGALGLWRGTPLAELRSEPFAAPAFAHLEELRVAALEERLDADLALGRHTELVTELQGLVAEYPYRERLRAQLMLALYRSGRQADALHAYQTGRRTLSDDLGLVPSQQLRELESAILRHDEALSPVVNGSGAWGVDGSVARTSERPRARRRRRAAIAALAAAGLALAAAGVTALLLRDGSPPFTAPANSIAVIDPATNEVVDATPVAPRPESLAEGAGSVWVGNVDDESLTRIDPGTNRILKTIALPATPTGIAFGFGAVWVAHGRSGQLSRIDPVFDRVTDTVDLADRALYYSTGSVTVDSRWVWIVFGDSTLVRVDPDALSKPTSTLVGTGPAAVVAHGGSVWVSNSGDSTVQRFDPKTFREGPLKGPNTVGRTPSGMAAGEGALWVAIAGDDLVMRIDPELPSATPIRVGDRPEAVAIGADAVWVANRGDGTVTRIDPATNEVVRTVSVGNAPSGIAFAGGSVRVAIQPR